MPSAVVPSEVMVTVAGWPLFREGTSVSVNEASTWRPPLASSMAAPLGASKPGPTLTAVTIPSAGAMRVAWSTATCASSTCAWRSAMLARSLAIWARVALVLSRSAVSRSWAEASEAWAERRERTAAALSAVASTAPFLTESPTATLSSLTGQVRVAEPPPFELELLLLAGELRRLPEGEAVAPGSGEVPRSPPPVGSRRSIVACAVRYCVLACPLAMPGAKITIPTAATPTTIRARAATILRRMGILSRHGLPGGLDGADHRLTVRPRRTRSVGPVAEEVLKVQAR